MNLGRQAVVFHRHPTSIQVNVQQFKMSDYSFLCYAYKRHKKTNLDTYFCGKSNTYNGYKYKLFKRIKFEW